VTDADPPEHSINQGKGDGQRNRAEFQVEDLPPVEIRA
jgi:hypothetical protein